MTDPKSQPRNSVVRAANPAGPADLKTALGMLARNPLYWLLVAVPAAVGMEMFAGGELWIFVLSGLAIIPLAGLMGRATENLAETLGAGLGGFLNATFGNAAELIIAMIAVSRGPEMYPLVKASITGSIIGNILLVLGLAIFLGGLKFPRQTFNRTAAGMGATLLALASVGLIVPTLYYYLFRAGSDLSGAEIESIEFLSEEIAGILAFIYVLSLVFRSRHTGTSSRGPRASCPRPAATTSPSGAGEPRW